MGESGLKRYLLKSIVPAGIAGAILLRSAQAESRRRGCFASSAPPSWFPQPFWEEEGRQGGALAMSESWELHVWAAVCPTCLVKKRPGHLGDPVLSQGGCFPSPEGGTMGNAPSEVWPTPGRLSGPGPGSQLWFG